MELRLLRKSETSAFSLALLAFCLLASEAFLDAWHPAYGEVQTLPRTMRRPQANGSAPSSSIPVDVYRRQIYHNSGTAGRMGLGASPFHPEGPGNVVTPGW